MAWRPFMTQVARHQSEFDLVKSLFVRSYFSVNKFGDRAGNRLSCTQERFQSSYISNLAR
ncbi:hypothetical protein Lalb_Chr22g0356131 [Lupinus albus]|uniref:Uncharacterized protein n=1 Tax=Lupinus albus TaxID=3870 RepID=A0A6A4N8U2_LUPAL|nr:hypothetical protein Lalb_Chr22g0356131 [Lupinus albus]